MTFYVEHELRCDGPPGADPFACDEAFHAPTKGQALDTAKKRGWKVSRRDGKTIHQCARHKDSE